MAKSGKALSRDMGRVNVSDQDNSTSTNSGEDAKSSQGQKARNDFKMVEDMLALVHFHFEIPTYYLSLSKFPNRNLQIEQEKARCKTKGYNISSRRPGRESPCGDQIFL
jgi:hypothetical protein